MTFVKHLEYRTGRRAASFAAVVGLLLSLLVATPASAAPQCGSAKVVRVSISYQACTNLVNGAVVPEIWFQNNHGSAVDGYWQYGYRGRGSTSITWNPTIIEVTIATGHHPKRAGNPAITHCISQSLVVRVASTASFPPPWGDSSFSPLRSWPC
jgi:hypothetical protein